MEEIGLRRRPVQWAGPRGPVESRPRRQVLGGGLVAGPAVDVAHLEDVDALQAAVEVPGGVLEQARRGGSSAGRTALAESGLRMATAAWPARQAALRCSGSAKLGLMTSSKPVVEELPVGSGRCSRLRLATGSRTSSGGTTTGILS